MHYRSSRSMRTIRFDVNAFPGGQNARGLLDFGYDNDCRHQVRASDIAVLNAPDRELWCTTMFST